MKHVPNIITVSRIFISVLIPFFLDHTAVFLVFYLLCGLTDMLDGYIARKTNTKSELGARLDSCADLVMFVMIIISVIILGKDMDLSRFYPLLAAVCVIRTVGFIYALWKYHSAVFLHTWMNKLAGFLVFFSPILLKLSANAVYFYIILIIAVLAAAEEVIIHSKEKQPDLNRKGLFFR